MLLASAVEPMLWTAGRGITRVSSLNEKLISQCIRSIVMAGPSPTITFNNGYKVPVFGLGTWKVMYIYVILQILISENNKLRKWQVNAHLSDRIRIAII